MFLLVGIVGLTTCAHGAGSPACKKRLFQDRDVASVKALVEKEGRSAFVEALKEREFSDDIYDLPLHAIEVEDGGKPTNLGIIIGELNPLDADEKVIMDSYFSRSGKEYLKELLGKCPTLEEVSTFLTTCPFVIEYVNPFDVVMDHLGDHSLGYAVELGVGALDVHATAIQQRYNTGVKTWTAYRQEAIAQGNKEIPLIDSHLLRKEFEKQIETDGVGSVLAHLESGSLADKIYDLDWSACEVLSADGITKTSWWDLLREEVKKDDATAKKVYCTYLQRGGKAQLREIAAKGDLAELAYEAGICPTVWRNVNLFDPRLGDVGARIEEQVADADAQAIKAVFTPQKWNQFKARGQKAAHIKGCITQNSLDAEGIEILKEYAKSPHNHNDWELYVQEIKSGLPKQIAIALTGTDSVMIEELESWLRGIDEAGISLEGTETSASYQAKLTKRKEHIVLLHKTAPSKSSQEKKAPEVSAKKLFLVGAGLVVTYFLVDYLRNYGADKPQRKPKSAEEYERMI